ncbi:hypothetical protein BTO09_11415 [Gilvibacter sp. SZ-19]|nr:hypothetical protein BTO09_11415 [Gilvibacter sp. SZ-19]
MEFAKPRFYIFSGQNYDILQNLQIFSVKLVLNTGKTPNSLIYFSLLNVERKRLRAANAVKNLLTAYQHVSFREDCLRN